MVQGFVGMIACFYTDFWGFEVEGWNGRLPESSLSLGDLGNSNVRLEQCNRVLTHVIRRTVFVQGLLGGCLPVHVSGVLCRVQRSWTGL